MEKSFIVTNKKFLKEIEDFWEGEKKKNEFIKKFLRKRVLQKRDTTYAEMVV